MKFGARTFLSEIRLFALTETHIVDLKMQNIPLLEVGEEYVGGCISLLLSQIVLKKCNFLLFVAFSRVHQLCLLLVHIGSSSARLILKIFIVVKWWFKNCSVQFTVNLIQFTLYSVHLQFTVNTLQFTVYTVQFTVYTVQFTVYTVTVQFTLLNVQCTL